MTIKSKLAYCVAMGDSIVALDGSIQTVKAVRINKSIMPWMYEVLMENGKKLVCATKNTIQVVTK